MWLTAARAKTAATPPPPSILDRLVLRTGEVWSGRGPAAPACVRVQSGTVWVTEEGDPEDHVLCEGEAYRARGDGLVVIEAVEDAVLILRPRPGGPGSRMA
jgi:hypothetical protein